jgi:hypothetical protein
MFGAVTCLSKKTILGASLSSGIEVYATIRMPNTGMPPESQMIARGERMTFNNRHKIVLILFC